MDGCLMNKEKKVLAFDFGASGGRAIIGIYNGESIYLKEIHRFSNDPVTVTGTMYWDILRLFYEIKQSLVKAKFEGGVDSIGVDTWGVDFGLLDEAGRLLENPVHYRDSHTAGMLEKSFKKISRAEFYAITGNQFMELNTAFQLLSLVEKRPQLVERAETMLLMPDLFNYLLSGEKTTEYSIASTTQLLDAKAGTWSDKVIRALGLPRKLFTPIVSSGTKIGKLTDEICSELGIAKMDVIAVAGHDTQSALAAVPTAEKDFIFLSCGTWSLLGTELDEPIINEKSRACNITNEGGYGQKISLLKNIIGLWLIQESRRQWLREGKEYSFGMLEEMANSAKSLTCFIDPDAPQFVAAGNIPERIREFCKHTNQPIPQTVGEMIRCINESLALKYRYALKQLIECTGKTYNTIHMVGGGTQSKLLCQFTANACQREVKAGPVEATVLGNIVLQLIASGDVKDLAEGRNIIRNSQELVSFSPQEAAVWDDAYQKFKELIVC
jgi:rhamnulokinase